MSNGTLEQGRDVENMRWFLGDARRHAGQVKPGYALGHISISVALPGAMQTGEAMKSAPALKHSNVCTTRFACCVSALAHVSCQMPHAGFLSESSSAPSSAASFLRLSALTAHIAQQHLKLAFSTAFH